MFTVGLVWGILIPYWATKSETFPRKFHTSQPYTHMMWILVTYEPLWHKNLLGTRKEYDQFLQCLQAWHTSDQIPLRLISDVDKQCIEHGDLLTWKFDQGTGFLGGPNFRKMFSFCVSERHQLTRRTDLDEEFAKTFSEEATFDGTSSSHEGFDPTFLQYGWLWLTQPAGRCCI